MNVKRLVAVFSLAIMVASFVGCANEKNTNNTNPESNSKLESTNLLTPSEIRVEIGKTSNINPTMITDKNFKNIVYETSDETIATVDENGVVTGISEGSCTIKTKLSTESPISLEGEDNKSYGEVDSKNEFVVDTKITVYDNKSQPDDNEKQEKHNHSVYEPCNELKCVLSQRYFNYFVLKK